MNPFRYERASDALGVVALLSQASTGAFSAGVIKNLAAYGDAGFYGSLANAGLNAPVVGMAPSFDV